MAFETQVTNEQFRALMSCDGRALDPEVLDQTLIDQGYNEERRNEIKQWISTCPEDFFSL